MIILSAVAISNVALNFCLIPIYGGIGAGIATLIAQALMLGLLVYRVQSKFGFFGFGPAAGANRLRWDSIYRCDFCREIVKRR